MLLSELSSRPNRQLSPHVDDLLKIGPGERLGPVNKLGQVELLGIPPPQPQVNPQDFLSFPRRGQVPPVQLVEPPLAGEFDPRADGV
jgi:hypothetical protein